MLSWILMTKSSVSSFIYRLKISQILLLGLILRLFCAFLLWDQSNYDIDSYFLVSQHVLAREDTYGTDDTLRRHPYLPLQMYWVGIARVLSEQANLPFAFVVKWAYILADICLAFVIYDYLKQTSTAEGKKGALLYALNPIALFISSYHGQFDALPLLFSILGLFALSNHCSWKAGFWLGLGIWVKSFPILALPTAVRLVRTVYDKVVVLSFSLFIPLLGVMFYVWVYNSTLQHVFMRAVGYNHGIGVYGYTYLLRLIALSNESLSPQIKVYLEQSRFVTLGFMIIVWFIALGKTANPFRIYFITLLSFMALTHAFSIQYLVWVIPLAIMVGEERWLLRYTLASFSYAFLVYNTLINNFSIDNILPWPQADLWIIIPASIPVWLLSLVWLISLILPFPLKQISSRQHQNDGKT